MEIDPSILYCPISHSIFLEPVTLPGDGYTYEKYEILKWLEQHSTSPMTREPIIHQQNIYENIIIKNLVQNYLYLYPEKACDQFIYPSQVQTPPPSPNADDDNSTLSYYELRRLVVIEQTRPVLRFASGALAGCVVGIIIVLLYGWLYGFIAVLAFSFVFGILSQKCN